MNATSTAAFAAVYIAVGCAGTLLLMSGGVLTVRADCPAEPCDNRPCCNGDVNADGNWDIADAVSLLAYLFGGGPPPVAIESPECDTCCPPTQLPATGQTLCYNTAGATIDCNSSVYPSQDGFCKNGCPMEERFVDNGDGTVLDNCTGLMWQQVTAPGAYTWTDALLYCDHLELGMNPETDEPYDNWRLPNVRELQSIVDYGRAEPAINRVFGAASLPYWTSTTDVQFPWRAWHVYFGLGNVNENSTKTSVVNAQGAFMCVRAVRSIDVNE